jgi:hypothetical protein
MDDPADDDGVAAVRAEAAAVERRSMVERGRQIGGVPGAVMAGIMVALRDIYEPPRDNGAVVVDSPSQPHDVDRDGMDFAATELDSDADVTIAALERRPPVVSRRRRWSRRR